MARKRQELARNAEDFQNQTRLLRLEIKEGYVSNDYHQKEIEGLLREQRDKYEAEIKEIVQR